MTDEPQIRINGQEYEIPNPLTLGEQRAIKRVSGMRWQDVLGELEHGDPDALTGFLFAVLHRRHPERSEASLIAEIERLTQDDLDVDNPTDNEAEGEEMRPPNGSSGSPNRATTPAASGIPASDLPAISAPATWPT
jgi:hypothetical protein